jgi:hypothetical protein
MRRLLISAALVISLAAPATADVTVTATTSGKGMGAAADAQSITYIKGGRMRADTQMGDQQLSTIIDLEKQQLITINHKKKEAEVHDLAKLSQEMQQAVKGSPRVSFTPNGQTRQILDQSCAGYDVRIEMPFAAGGGEGMDMNVVLSGPVWIAKGAPGSADYAAFYKQAADKGMFFTDPRQARAAPGQAKSMAEMYRAVAETGGVPYAMDISIKFEGQGPMAAMMSRMGSSSMTTTVTNVSAAPLGAELFAVPAGFKARTR